MQLALRREHSRRWEGGSAEIELLRWTMGQEIATLVHKLSTRTAQTQKQQKPAYAYIHILYTMSMPMCSFLNLISCNAVFKERVRVEEEKSCSWH